MFAGHVNLKENKQLVEIIKSIGEKMTTHSHMKNKEKSYNQVKEDVQSDDTQRIIQKADDKGIIEIKGMFGKEEIHSYEYETNSFLKKIDEANRKQINNLMVCSGSGSQLEGLVMKLFEETLMFHSFETNILCVNAGYTEVQQLLNVIIRERKSKDMIFRKLEEGNSHNLVIQREVQLLNIAVVNYTDIGQLLRTEAKGEHRLEVDIEDFVDDK